VIIELTIVGLSTALIVILSRHDFRANRSLSSSMQTMLTPVSIRGTTFLDDSTQETHPVLVTRSEVLSLIENFQNVYYSLGKNTLDNFRIHHPVGEVPLKLTVERTVDPTSPDSTTQQYNLFPLISSTTKTENYTFTSQPYDDPDFLVGVVSFGMQFHFRHCQILYSRVCKIWHLKYNFQLKRSTFDSGDMLLGIFDLQNEVYNRKILTNNSIVLQITLALLVVVLVSILTLLREPILRVFGLISKCCLQCYNRGRRCCCLSREERSTDLVNYPPISLTFSIQSPNARNIRAAVEYASRNTWNIISMLRDALMFTGVLQILAERTRNMKSVEDTPQRILVFALAVFFAYASLIPHIRLLGPEYFATLRTLQEIFPFVSKFMIGCLPFFLGFVLCSLALFARFSPSFRTVGEAISTLWAVTNGDWLYDNFRDSEQFYPYLSRAFFYIFMLLFITVISKLALSFVEFIFFKAMPTPEHMHPNKETKEEENHNHKVKNLDVTPSFERTLLPQRKQQHTTKPEEMILGYAQQCTSSIQRRLIRIVNNMREVHPKFDYLTKTSMKDPKDFLESVGNASSERYVFSCIMSVYKKHYLNFVRECLFREMQNYCEKQKLRNSSQQTITATNSDGYSSRAKNAPKNAKKVQIVVPDKANSDPR